MKRFVEEGGLLITVRDTAEWAVTYGLARWITVAESETLHAAGSILRADVIDKKSPVAAGYDEFVPVHFAGGPIFKVGGEMGRRWDRDQQRPSGRGSKSDPDVPQGRAFVEMPEKPKPGPGEEGFQRPENLAFYFEPYIPKVEERPRVILAFPKEADNILLSGMLEGGDQIAGKPVVIDSPLGKGHILLYACNPMWRNNTQGTYALLLNPVFNYQNLSLGWPPEPEKKK